MKLYEFTVTDKHNLPEPEIKKIAEESAAQEGQLRGWGDYRVSERRTPEQGSDGVRRYFFEVEGNHAPSSEDDEGDVNAPPARRKTPDVAAKEH